MTVGRAFFDIAFTPDVQAEQARKGSRAAYGRAAQGAPTGAALGGAEAAFIGERDGFYQATVSQTGWPYLQFRGGPAGFVQVLDAHTLAYADLRGNRQYISVGNLRGNDRVALFFMDYAEQRRLKLLGRVRLVQAADDPALMERLRVPGQHTPAERAVVIDVVACDWNCPQHITPRFTAAEVQQGMAEQRA